MMWNWQRKDWPAFRWNEARLRKAEEQFLLGAGVFAGILRHLSSPDREQLTIEAISSEALTTSEIEGEILNRASVQSSVRREFGLKIERRRATAAEQGISQLMVDLYRSYAEPLSGQRLFDWHRMLFQQRRRIRDIGRYRSGEDAMEIVSGPMHEPRVHFEAPASKKVPEEMDRFVDWFNQTSPAGSDSLPALTRAGIAHLYFESIHPFSDGNGRIGRAISEKALAQAFRQPALTALAATILPRRKAYYAALEAANRSNEVTAWLAWFAGITIEAQRRTAAMAEFLIEKTRLLDRLRGGLNARQEKALLRILREGTDGFEGGVSATNYMSITGASAATATRDLSSLVEQGALAREGERRYARYRLTIRTGPIAPVVIDENGNF